MTQITDYSTLKSKAAQMYGSGRTDMADYWGDFVQLAEAEINRALRLNPQTGVTTLTSASSVLTAPADFARFRSIRQTETNKPKIVLTDIVEIERYLGEVTETGDPVYACELDGTIYLAPAPADSVTFRVVYTKKVAALSDSNTSNWLLLSDPDVYLWGTLEQAALWDHDDAAMSNYRGKFQLALATLKKADREDQWGDRLEMQPNGGVA